MQLGDIIGFIKMQILLAQIQQLPKNNLILLQLRYQKSNIIYNIYIIMFFETLTLLERIALNVLQRTSS